MAFDTCNRLIPLLGFKKSHDPATSGWEGRFVEKGEIRKENLYPKMGAANSAFLKMTIALKTII